MRSFHLRFDGCILDSNRSKLPTYSGIYLVYRGRFTPDRKSLICREIMYIGQATDIRRRHGDHEKRFLFLNRLEQGEVLFYSYSKLDVDDLNRVENALIYKHKPVLNEYGKDSFLYPDTEVVSDGQCALLNHHFIVDTTI